MQNKFCSIRKIKFLFFAAAFFLQLFCIFSQENKKEDKNLFEQKIEWEKDENAYGYNIEIRELKTGKKYNFETDENFVNLNLSAGKYEYQVTVLNPFGRVQSKTEWNSFEILQAKTPEFVKIPEKVVVPSGKNEKFSIEADIDNVNEDTSVFLVNEKTKQKVKGTLVIEKSADGAKSAAAEFPKVEEGEWKLCAENPFSLKKESLSIKIVDQKTEEARIAEEKRIQQEKVLQAQKEAEAKLAAEKAEKERLAKIEEEKRLAEEARLKAEAEKARLAEIAKEEENKRLAEESRIAEEKRIQQEKELQAQKEAEAKLAAEKAEKERLAKIEEEKRLAEEARLKAEAEKARLAEIAKEEEKKRLAEESRIAEEKQQEPRSLEEKSASKKARRIFGFYVLPEGGIFYSPFFNEFSDGKVLPFAGVKIGFAPELKNANRFGIELESDVSRYSIKSADYEYSDSFSLLKLNLLYQRRISKKSLKLNFRAGGNLMFIQNFMDYKNSTIQKKDAAYGYLGVHGGPSLVFSAGNLNIESGFDYSYEFIGGMPTDFLSPFISVGFRW